jgi:hypothetical protein
MTRALPSARQFSRLKELLRGTEHALGRPHGSGRAGRHLVLIFVHRHGTMIDCVESIAAEVEMLRVIYDESAYADRFTGTWHGRSSSSD